MQHLSDDDLNVYAALVQAGDNARWALGDKLCQDVGKYGSAADLYREVSKVGEKISTLRGCHWLSLHVPQIIRDLYPLSRSQFRACLGWAVLADDLESRLDLLEDMCVWVIDHNMATVQAIETEVRKRKLLVELDAKKAEYPEWVYPRTEMGARLRACEVLLNGEMDKGMVALVRVLTL